MRSLRLSQGGASNTVPNDCLSGKQSRNFGSILSSLPCPPTFSSQMRGIECRKRSSMDTTGSRSAHPIDLSQAVKRFFTTVVLLGEEHFTSRSRTANLFSERAAKMFSQEIF